MKLFNRYIQYYQNHFSPPVPSVEMGLPHLRNRLFISILLLTFPIGLIVYIPSFIVALTVKEYVIAFFDTIALLSVSLIFFIKNLDIRLKKLIFSAVFTILAVILFIYLGVKGPSLIIFFFISILLTLFYNRNAGLVSVTFNWLVYMLLVLVFPKNSALLTFSVKTDLGPWLDITLNYLAFNYLAVLSVSSLVDQLNKSLLKERELQQELKKESLELMKAKQKAETSDQLKTSFINNISHEIRTPLNSILGFGKFLIDPDFSDAEKNQYYLMIQVSSNRLLSLVTNFIDISLIRNGNQKVFIEEVNINQKLEEVINHFEPHLVIKKISIHLVPEKSNNHREIATDGILLGKILMHLIDNAIKFTNEGVIKVGYTFTGKEIRFYIKDSGVGISEEYSSDIFNSFSQEDISMTRGYEGSGLGLSIAKGFIELLGGKIWFESQKGIGSTFYFTIPAKEEEALESVSELRVNTTERLF